MMAETKSVTKWNQHPLISTVLWILGTDECKVENIDRNCSGNSNVLKWKDEGGGNINEFFSQVQCSEASSKRTVTETQLQPGASQFLQEKKSNVLSKQNQVTESDPSNNDYTPSPQWGFYVPITPPQQEMFPHSGILKHTNYTQDHK